MPDQTTASSGGFLSGTRANDVLAALQNGVQAINNAANTITTKISSVVTANPGGSSGQLQVNSGTGFTGMPSMSGDATLNTTTGVITVGSNAITYAKLQNESSGTLLGNLGTGSTIPAEQKSSTVTAFLAPFSSVVQGVVNPSSNSNSSGFYLGGDNAFHAVAGTPGLTYLGTVTTISSQIVDSSTTSNIINANSTTYRSFQLIVKNVIPTNTTISLLLQIHSGGAFQTNNYFGSAFVVNSAGTGAATSTQGIPLSNTGNDLNSAPGAAGTLTVSNLSGTTDKKQWVGTISHFGVGSVQTTLFTGGYWNGGNGAIDGFQIAPSAGAISSGNVDVYGIL